MKRIVILISGNGSNLQAIMDACARGSLDATVCGVISNRADAYGLVRATEAGIPTQTLQPKAFSDREAFDKALMAAIDAWLPDAVVLAGYMRILSPTFVTHYAGKLLNIHPSLLPKYPGLHTHRRALENGDTEHGTSVHFVTEQLDSGPIILQARVPIFPGDSEDEIISRVQHQEHAIYPLAISWLLTGRLMMKNNQALLDGIVLPAQGYAAEE